MAIYQTGAATSIGDLFARLQSFAAANGFTIHYAGNRTSGNGIALQVSRGALHGTFLSDTTSSSTDPGPRVGTYCHDAYGAGGGTESQANGAAKTYANAITMPAQAFHFFCGGIDDPPYLYVTLETEPGTYKHLGIGQMVKQGQYETGLFNFAVRWSYNISYISNLSHSANAIAFDAYEDNYRNGSSLQVRADSDGISPRWFDPYSGMRLCGGFRNFANTGNQRPTMYRPVTCGSSQITGRTILTPCWLAGERGSGLYSPLGYPPGIRWVRLDYLAPGEVLNIAGDQWKVFPIIRKQGQSGQPNSDVFGYAYRID